MAKEFNPDSTFEFELVKTFSSQRMWYINMWKGLGYDLEGIEWRTLNVIWTEGPTPQAKFVSMYHRDKAFITRLIDKMVKKGWVYREADPEDRRSMIIYLTEQGAGMRGELLKTFMEARKRTLRGISEKEQQVLVKLLRHYRNNLL